MNYNIPANTKFIFFSMIISFIWVLIFPLYFKNTQLFDKIFYIHSFFNFIYTGNLYIQSRLIMTVERLYELPKLKNKILESKDSIIIFSIPTIIFLYFIDLDQLDKIILTLILMVSLVLMPWLTFLQSSITINTNNLLSEKLIFYSNLIFVITLLISLVKEFLILFYLSLFLRFVIIPFFFMIYEFKKNNAYIFEDNIRRSYQGSFDINSIPVVVNKYFPIIFRTLLIEFQAGAVIIYSQFLMIYQSFISFYERVEIKTNLKNTLLLKKKLDISFMLFNRGNLIVLASIFFFIAYFYSLNLQIFTVLLMSLVGFFTIVFSIKTTIYSYLLSKKSQIFWPVAFGTFSFIISVIISLIYTGDNLMILLFIMCLIPFTISSSISMIYLKKLEGDS